MEWTVGRFDSFFLQDKRLNFFFVLTYPDSQVPCSTSRHPGNRARCKPPAALRASSVETHGRVNEVKITTQGTFQPRASSLETPRMPSVDLNVQTMELDLDLKQQDLPVHPSKTKSR